MYESISKNNELENEMTLDMSYFWYSDDAVVQGFPWHNVILETFFDPIICRYHQVLSHIGMKTLNNIIFINFSIYD